MRKVLDHSREEQESARGELCWVLMTLQERSGLNILCKLLNEFARLDFSPLCMPAR